MLKLEKLHIGYKNKTVAKNIESVLSPGELVCLLGPNGTGKSTLLKTAAGLISRLSGNIMYGEKDLRDFNPKEKAQIVSIVLTEPIGVGNFSVIEVLRLGRYPYMGWWGNPNDRDDEKIQEALENTKITHLAYRQLAELSDGEKQKTMIARALAQDTEYILLDEPTSHLDLPSKIEIMALLKGLAHRWNKAVLVSTHDLNLAIQTADKFWLINKEGNFHQGTNEDLILGGALNDCFEMGNDQYDFATGRISFHTHNNLFVTIKGRGAQATWTKHAFERLGYQLGENADLEIHAIGNKKWSLRYFNDHYEFHSIEALLQKISKI